MGRTAVIGSASRHLCAAALVLTGLAGAALGWTPRLSAHEAFVSVGTGETNGLYYPVAQAICKTIGPELRAQGIGCSPEATPGSVYNVARIQSGELELAVVQSDVEYAASRGLGAWKGKPVSDLRSVLSLYPELVTVIARAGANIQGLTDLAGKRVNVGGAGSGTRETWDTIAGELGKGETGQVKLSDLHADETTAALCRGAIDANLLIVGHPSPLVASQLGACPSNLVAITGPVVVKLVGTNPFFVRGAIPAKLYGKNAEIQTFGGRATLVTAAAADPRVVAAITKAILTHVPELRAAHPVLAGLKAEEMTQGLTAPLHPAAAAVYKELGLPK
jgi:TRAP transporter TAXI family solute receptor